jgi:hypothetical protein
LGRSRHTPAELSKPVRTLEQTLLIAVPLEATKQTTERSIKLVGVDLLVCLSNVLEDLANVLGNLGGLAHIEFGSFKLACGILERETTETTADLALLKRRENNPTLTLLASATSATETVDVGLTVTGETDLDDVGDIREVHATCCDVGGEENTRLAGAEIVRSAGTLCLRELGVDLEATEARKGSVALEATAELVENGRSKSDFCGRVVVDDGLEGAGVAGQGLLLLLEDELVESRHDVLESSDHNLLLGNTGVGRLLFLVDTLGEVETRAHCTADKIDDIAGNGGREHEVLALNLLWVGEVLLDIVDLFGETVVQQAVGLVHDQSVQVGRLDAGVRVREDIKETTGSADEQMAALALCPLQHLTLHGSTDGGLHNETGILGDLLRLNGNLFRELTGRGDDDGPDVVRLCALVTADLLAELGVACDDTLDDGDEETECFTSTGLCLRNNVNAAEGLVNGPLLNIGHSLNLHLLGNGVDDVGVHETASSELCELCGRSFFSNGLLCLNLLRNLLPLCAAVESGDGSIGDAG